jgi:hypothetical protein
MESIAEIIDAVKDLDSAERADLFQRLRALGLESPAPGSQEDFSRYGTEEFTRQLTDHFHEAKRRALGNK